MAHGLLARLSTYIPRCLAQGLAAQELTSRHCSLANEKLRAYRWSWYFLRGLPTHGTTCSLANGVDVYEGQAKPGNWAFVQMRRRPFHEMEDPRLRVVVWTSGPCIALATSAWMDARCCAHTDQLVLHQDIESNTLLLTDVTVRYSPFSSAEACEPFSPLADRNPYLFSPQLDGFYRGVRRVRVYAMRLTWEHVLGNTTHMRRFSFIGSAGSEDCSMRNPLNTNTSNRCYVLTNYLESSWSVEAALGRGVVSFKVARPHLKGERRT